MAEPSVRIPKGVTRDEVLNQIRAGTHDALAEMIRSASGGTRQEAGAPVAEPKPPHGETGEPQKGGDEERFQCGY